MLQWLSIADRDDGFLGVIIAVGENLPEAIQACATRGCLPIPAEDNSITVSAMPMPPRDYDEIAEIVWTLPRWVLISKSDLERAGIELDHPPDDDVHDVSDIL